MRFKIWIDSVGQSKLARRLNVHRSTVSRWRSGERSPNDRLKTKIVSTSKGIITYNDIMEVFNGARVNTQLKK